MKSQEISFISLFKCACVPLFITLMLNMFALNASASGLAVGKPAPFFEIKTLSGVTITPASAKGKILIINVWATWCEPCRKEMPEIEAFYQKYHDQGVDVVAVSMDDASEIETIKTVMKSFTFPAAVDKYSDLHKFGRMWRMPVTFVIDQNGILRRNGWDSEPVVDAAILEKVVTPLLGSPTK